MARPKLRVVNGKRRKKKPDPISPGEKRYLRTLHAFINQIYNKADKEFGLKWPALAAHAQLSISTVNKLGDKITRYPRFYTLVKLAEVVGLGWELQQLQTVSKATAQLRIAAHKKVG